MERFSIEYALLAMQRALLDEVTPDLRAVVMDVNKEKQIFYAEFYYDGEPSEKMIDLWQCAITEASAALGPDCFVNSDVKRWDYPKKIPSWGSFAYLRQEPQAVIKKNAILIEEMSFGYAMLAMQNALLGVVTPELRTVIVDFVKETPFLYIRFYYSGEVSEALIQLWQSAISQAIKDFGCDCSADTAVERLDYPEKAPFRGRYAYFRKER